MEFVNLTPFGALAYRGLDARDREYHVFTLRTVYRLQHAHQGQALAQDWFDPVLIEEDAPSLVTADEFFGAPGQSSTRAESDLAPYKPRCDVLVTGHSHAPGGQPTRNWISRLRVSVPELATHRVATTAQWPALTPDAGFHERVAWQQASELATRDEPMPHGPDGQRSWRVLLDKRLGVHGPRHFGRGALGRWSLAGGRTATRVPLTWEHAYGGGCTVPNPAHGRDPSRPEHLLNEVCYTNPLGCGWLHADWPAALQRAGQTLPEALRAPQFEYLDDPVLAPDWVAQPPGLDVQRMAEMSRHYAHRPAGFGALGRPWTPRIQLAGHYDEVWLERHWPGLPRDFDMGYWNCAPADQQIAYPRPDMLIELGHLLDPALAPSGHAVVAMPGHRAAVLLHLKGGLMMGCACVIDTVQVDTDAMALALVWRAAVGRDMVIDRAEMRFEIDPARPLVMLEPPAPATAQESAHG